VPAQKRFCQRWDDKLEQRWMWRHGNGQCLKRMRAPKIVWLGLGKSYKLFKLSGCRIRVNLGQNFGRPGRHSHNPVWLALLPCSIEGR
jgi:hypothetical protein